MSLDMDFATDRKRARGLGSAKAGAGHHWAMIKSSVGLLILIPLFVFTFGPILGSSYEEAVAYYSRPFPAVVAGLTLTVGWVHFMSGAQTMLEDYLKGLSRQVAIIAVNVIGYAAIAAGLFALVKLAL